MIIFNMFNNALHLILCMVLSACSCTTSSDGGLQQYLTRKLLYVNNQLNINIPNHSIKEEGVHQSFEFLSQETNAAENFTWVSLVNLFNRSYAFNGALYEIIPSEIRFLLHKVENFTVKQDIRFIRSIYFHDMQFMLICLENGVSDVYTAKDISQITLVHSIKNPDFIKDSTFFINENKLHLVTTSNFGSASVTLIYEWVGTYFDQINEISSKNAVSIFTFSVGKSEIVTILQNSTIWEENSFVYEFKHNKVTKIQLLPTSNPHFMAKYIFDDNIYLTIFYETYATLYKWNELEMVLLLTSPIPLGVEKISTTYIGDIPLFFIITKRRIFTYNPTEQFRLLANYTLEPTFDKIYDMDVKQHNDKFFLYYFGKTTEGIIVLNSHQFSLYRTETDNKMQERDDLTTCLSNLESKLDNKQQELNDFIENERNVPTTFNETEKETSKTGRVSENSNIEEERSLTAELYRRTISILDDIDANITDLFQQDSAIFDERVNILGKLEAFFLEGKKIYVSELNSIQWVPEKWLSYRSVQSITGKITAKYLNVTDIWIPKTNLYNNILLVNAQQIFTGPIKFRTLRSNDLYVSSINRIHLDNLYFKGSSIRISGTKTFNNLKTNILNMEYLNGGNTSNILQYFTNSKNASFNFGFNVNISNLQVDELNNVNWNTFKDSVFRIGTNERITGNLVMKNYFRVKALKTKTLNEIAINAFLTKTTKQNITSKLNFGILNATNIQSSDINGINFDSDIITLFDAEKIVKGPITIESVVVLKNIYANLSNDSKEQQFQQIYKKTKIKGTVRIENLSLQPDLVMNVSGKELNTANITNRFWLKHTDQVIPVHVKVLRGITAQHLRTDLLNGLKINNYMINNLEDKPTTAYKFRNVTIIGNVTINDAVEHFPNLLELNRTSVKLTGSFEITGKKTFTGTLTANTARVNYLDGVDTSRALTVNHEELFGAKQFENIIVKGNLNVKHCHMRTLNNMDLNSIYDRYLSTAKTVYFDALKLENITVDNLQTVTLNNENLNKCILNLDKLNAIVELNQIEIIGDVTMKNIAKLSELNNINFNIIADKISGEPLMTGNVKFTNKVHIKHFNTHIINNVDISELAPNILCRDCSQSIAAKQYFMKLRTSALIVDYINNIDMRYIVNTKTRETQELLLRNRLTLQSPTFKKSLSGNLPCSIANVASSIKKPPAGHWTTVTILKNATIEDPQHILHSILENSVRIRPNNTITAPAIFTRVTAKEVYTKKPINNVDIHEIYKDALLKFNHDELVTGVKTFLQLTIAGGTVYGDAQIPIVNTLLVKEIDKSIIPKDKIADIQIKGHKTFRQGLYTTKLNTDNILNVKPENLVSVDNLKPIPRASFDTLRVLHNLDIFNMNGNNFTNFLQNRILKNSLTKQILSGIYYFDNINITGEALIPAINKINLAHVIFDTGVQNVSGPLEFTQDLVIVGDVNINRFNGINITEEYGNSVLINKGAKIEGNILFKNVSRINNISTKSLNSIPIQTIKTMLLSETPKILASIVHDTIEKVNNIIETSSKVASVLPRNFMYLDKYHEFPLSFGNAVSSKTIESRDGTIVHLISREPGYMCGLDTDCTCLVQNTIQITSEYSLHLFASADNQRIYSYEDNTVIIHIITDSISYSTRCKSSNASLTEYTTMTSVNKITGRTIVHKNEIMDGYIKDVEFFFFNNNIYIIISKMYITAMNTEQANCLILRFNERERDIKLLQEIPSTTSVIIHLFHAHEGVNLIVGNEFISNKTSEVMKIVAYKFDIKKETFSLLREWNDIHCMSAESVVFGRDSFIVLFQKNNHITVWRYNHQHLNYYFYQDLIIDLPIRSISTFNTGGLDSQTFICVVTVNEHFLIYNYQYTEGWKLLSRGKLEGLRLLIPFNLNKETYLFAPSAQNSSLLTIVKNGYH